ncbi:MAG TPA: hypothetical protein VGL59_03085 [Polyangia bacterium]
MAPRDQLLLILRRVRRRLRGLAALQGAVLGAAAVLVVGAPWVAVARWRGDGGSLSPGSLSLLIVGAAVAAALVAAVRPIPLQRCARQIDRTTAGGDRALSALAFIDQAVTPFIVAAISDAVERSGGVSAAAVAPLRRPRGTLVLLASAAALVVAVLAPLAGHRGRALATATVAHAAPIHPALLNRHDIDAETEEARAAAAAAQALADPTLAALAKELGDALRALTSAGLDRGEALDRLAALQRRAEQAARDAAALAGQLRRAGEALQATPATRPLAEGLNAGDAAATERAAADLAAGPASAGAAQRETLAQAFERAARQAAASEDAAAGRTGDNGSGARSSGSDSDHAGGSDDEAPRRLQRPSTGNDNQSPGGDDQNSAPAERRLQHLDRDLQDTAAACRDNPEACQRQLRQGGRSLPRMQQEARGAGARQRLSQAIQQLRERLRRGNEGQPSDSPEQRRQRQQQQRFARAANGQPNAARTGRRGHQHGQSDSDGNEGESDNDGDSDDPSQGDQPGDSDGDGNGSGDNASAAQPGGEGIAGESSAGAGERGQGDGASASAAGAATGGDGIGNQNGGDALGRQRDQRATHGREREAAVRSAAGPKRSQVIEAAAARGFAREDYRRVFQDYGAVIEESLDATAVPPGQRYLVRRYFQLIRPRAPTTAATRTAPPGGP